MTSWYCEYCVVSSFLFISTEILNIYVTYLFFKILVIYFLFQSVGT